MSGQRSTMRLALMLGCAASVAVAADGTWTLNNNGNWSTTTNWSNGNVAGGTDSTAFLSNSITSDRTITLDTAVTIGNIVAQDTSHNYTISGAQTLTFDTTSGTPTISVVPGRRLGFAGNTTLAGNDGLLLSGGSFSVTGATFAHTGGTTVDAEAVLASNNLGSGNWRLDNGVLSDYYRSTTGFSSGLGTGNSQVQLYGTSGFGGGNGNSNWRIGSQNSILKWGTVGEGATGFFNPTTLKFLSPFDNMGPSIYGQITLQNGIDLNGGARTIDVLQATGPNAIVSSFAKIDAGIKDTGAGGSLTKTGGGNLLIAGTSDYTGSIDINAGAVRFDSIASMSGSGRVQVNNGAILGVRVAGTGSWSGGTSGVGTLGGLIAGLGGSGASTVSYTGNVGLLLDVTANTSSAATITNAEATSLALYKMGGSSLTLSGTNTYSGGTFLQQGTLIADSADALGTSGDITFRGGTLQYTANSAATDFGSRIKNSASAITLNTNNQNATLSGMAAGNTGGLSKSGAGTLTFTGTNTYSGATTLSAGTIAVNNGTLSTSGGAVSFGAASTSVSVVGGAANATWNLGNQNLQTTSGGPYNNLQMVIDGDGVVGSALVTNVNSLLWGRSSSNSTILLTDGGQMNVNGQIQIGSPYYGNDGTNTNSGITIQGGAVNSTLTGTNSALFIGYGDRTGARDNFVTVNSGGVLNGISDVVIGEIANLANGDRLVSGNALRVNGSGTASLGAISIGYVRADAPANEVRRANANVVEVTNGGQLSSSGIVYIGRANNVRSNTNDNEFTVTGTGSTWNAGNQTVYVGHTNNASAQSNNNILTVSSGGSLTNVASLIVGFGTGTETGNQFVLNGGTLGATSITLQVNNGLSGNGTIDAPISVSGTGAATIDSLAGGTLTLNGAVTTTATGNVSFGGAGSIVVAGGLAGSGSVTKDGAGSLTLSGASGQANTTVNAGQLNINQFAALGIAAGTLTMADGTSLDNTSGAAVTITNPKSIALGNSLTFVGTDDLDLGEGTTTLSATTTFTVSAGTLTLSGDVVGTGFGIVKDGAGTLRLDGLTGSGSFTGNSMINAGTLLLEGSSLLGGGASTVVTLGENGFLQVGPSAGLNNVTIAGFTGNVISASVINANQDFTQNTTLTAANENFNGVQTIGSGVIVTAPANYLGTIPGSATAGRIVFESGATLAATAGFSINPNQGVALAAGTATVSVVGGQAVFFNSDVAGSGGLQKTGAGNLRLTGSNTYQGGTVVEQGILGISSGAALGDVSGALTIDGAILAAATYPDGSGTGATIDAGRTVRIGNGKTSGLHAQNLLTLRYDGAITEIDSQGPAGGLQFGLAGPREGTVILGGANTYRGDTILSAGTLKLGSGGSFASSPRIIVGDAAGSAASVFDLSEKTAFSIGGSQTLMGKGKVLLGPSTVLTIDGLLSPGNSPGVLAYDGGGTVNLSGTTLMEFAGTTRGTGYDAIDVLNGTTLNLGGILQLSFDQTFADGTTFSLFTPTDGSTLAGTFSTLSMVGIAYGDLTFLQEGTSGVWKTNLGQDDQTMTFTSSTGTLSISAVPEPATIALAALGVAALGYRLSRRRRA